MKKIVTAFMFFVATLFSTANAVDMTDPYKLANEVATTTLNEIKANKDKVSNAEFANEILSKNLMPYIDIKYAAYKVMGTSLKSTTEDDRKKFTQAFEKYMQKSFADILSKYTSQELVMVGNNKLDAEASMASVKFLIKEEGKKDLELVLKLRKNKKTGEWKAFDMIGENISILDAKQSEISPIIKNQGIDAAIKALENPVKK